MDTFALINATVSGARQRLNLCVDHQLLINGSNSSAFLAHLLKRQMRALVSWFRPRSTRGAFGIRHKLPHVAKLRFAGHFKFSN
jgi:hypothetical protein